MKTIIHVNRHRIAANKKTGLNLPVITAKTYKKNQYGNEVIINGPCRLVYRPDKPLSCGATVYIIVEDGVEVEVCQQDNNEKNQPDENCSV